mmetsp:Transcript_52847/g.151379  ORF Transcript_52847/g.151379 Transcript_52847/m.151379 type:complete len:294 (-) Transcript_52847:357-1238(-)
MERAPPRHGHLFACQPCAQLVCIHAKEPRSRIYGGIVDLNRCSIILVLVKTLSGTLLLHISKVNQARQNTQHVVDRLLVQADGLQGIAYSSEVRSVTGLESRQLFTATAREQAIIAVAFQVELLQLLIVHPPEHLIETMVCALAGAVRHDPGALKQVSGDAGIYQGTLLIEEDTVVLSESGRVGVPHRDSIAERLEDWLGLQNPILYAVGMAARCPRGEGNKLHHDFCRLGLPCSTLARDQQALVPLLSHECPVGCVCDRIRVWWQGAQVLPLVLGALIFSIQAPDVLVRVHG